MSPENRRTSFGMLLRRSKSGDLGKGGRKASKQGQPEQQKETIPKSPPRLPVLYNGAAPPQLQTFGGEPRPDSVAIVSGKAGAPTPSSARPSMDPVGRPSMQYPTPPVPFNPAAYVDPYARTESMTHRGRYSYASSAVSTINSPRRVRRRKDPTPFNVLVIGTRGSGKTSFIEFLKTALALPPKKRSKQGEEEIPVKLPQGNFIPHYLETEIDHERVGLTIWDSEGLEKNVVDLQLREMSGFLENKFEDTFAEEMKVVRSPGVQDTHIHAVFLVLDPARLDRNISAATKTSATNGHANGGKYQPHHQLRIIGSLDEDLDLQVLRTLQGKTTVIPVISKADTITSKHMSVLKKTVWDSLKKSKLDPLEALGVEDDDGSSSRIDEVDEEDEEEGDESLPIQGPDEIPEGDMDSVTKRLSSNSMKQAKEQGAKEEEEPFLPLSIISPDIYEPEVVGRQFPWGFADPYNDEHCNFVRLKEAVFSEWRGELREASREQWYEGWRTSRLKQRDGGILRR
ncbi:hypothetical protein MKZ38_009465 [Zalerion maritima]|uniref:Septin-type G domain-containing protein n=1 Tax=Zalerion maritima TaxID=339359 RepID=A0AAD5WTH8_9PEZI|nr:hypothetical protein MKZ38_009465 [Zalerion maritima]